MSEYLRVTVILPKKLWEEVKRVAPARQRSRLVTEALETEIRRRSRLEGLEELERFQSYMRSRYGEQPESAEAIERLRDERDHDLTDMR